MRTHAAQFNETSPDLHPVVPAQAEALIALQCCREGTLGDVLEVREQSLVSQSLDRRVQNGQSAAHRLPAAATSSDGGSARRRRSSCWLRQIGPANQQDPARRATHMSSPAPGPARPTSPRAPRAPLRGGRRRRTPARASQETPSATPRRRSSAGTPRTSRGSRPSRAFRGRTRGGTVGASAPRTSTPDASGRIQAIRPSSATKRCVDSASFRHSARRQPAALGIEGQTGGEAVHAERVLAVPDDLPTG